MGYGDKFTSLTKYRFDDEYMQISHKNLIPSILEQNTFKSFKMTILVVAIDL